MARGKAGRLRKRLERQPRVTEGLGAAAAAWIHLCHRTTRWETRGAAEVEAALRDGPVVIVFWHEMLAMPGIHWKEEWGPISALHTTRFAGRVAGAVQSRVGLSPIAMTPRTGNLAASREVMRRLRGGISVGLTADGPSGPRRVLKDAPLEWARATGRPVFTFGFASTRQVRLGTWDRLAWPLPFGRGAAIWRPWRDALPRRADAETLAALSAELSASLDAAVAEAEAIVGRAPYPQRP